MNDQWRAAPLSRAEAPASAFELTRKASRGAGCGSGDPPSLPNVVYSFFMHSSFGSSYRFWFRFYTG